MTWLYFSCNHSEYPVSLLFLDTSVDLKGHKILFEDIRRNGGEQQIKYDGTPFIVIGEKNLLLSVQSRQKCVYKTKTTKQEKLGKLSFVKM